MPLVRLAVRNEYGLGVAELYKDAVQVEDPKAVLDGVAVAGLVGILRQLGDLSEFAAEVFHGLQEQVAFTASRSRKLITRTHRIEASLPQIEKAMLSQTSHIRYAYTPGSKWHPHIEYERNHFISDDLPPFIMDSYEHCREPPHLQLLDRFDTGGPGSCLKRYSNPTFFRRASTSYEVHNGENSLPERKARKIKRRRSWHHTHCPSFAYTSNGSERKKLSSPTVHGQYSQSCTGSTLDTTFKSDLEEKSDSLGSKDEMDFIECVSHPSTSKLPDGAKAAALSSELDEETVNAHESMYLNGGKSGACSPSSGTTAPHCTSVTWDKKMEIIKPVGLNYETNGVLYVSDVSDLDEMELEPAHTNFNQVRYFSEHGSPPKSDVDEIQDVPKAYIDLDEDELKLVNAENVNQVDDLSEHEHTSNSHDDWNNLKTLTDGDYIEPSQQTGLDCGIDDVQYMLENFELNEHDLGSTTMKCVAQVEDLSGSENNSGWIADGSQISDSWDRNLGSSEPRHVLETNYDIAERESEAVNMESGCQVHACSEGENAVTVIEWNKLDDMESETDHYVDALNMIESEYESDFEGQTQKELLLVSSLKDELVENSINEHKAEISTHQEPERECHSVSYGYNEHIPGDSQNSTALVSSANMDSLGCEPSCIVSAAGIINHQEPEHDCHSISYDSKEPTPVDSHNSIALVSSFNMQSLDLAQSSCNVSAAAEDEERGDSIYSFGEQSVQHIQSSSVPEIPHGIDVCANKPSLGEIGAPAPQVPPSEETSDSPYLSQERSVGPSCTYPLAFWTNGTLLGLEPLKPTVFTSNPMSSGNNVSVGQSNPNSMQKVDGSTGLLALSEKDPRCDNDSTEPILDNGEQNAGSSEHMPHHMMGKKHSESINPDQNNLAGHSLIHGLGNGVMPHETKVPNTVDVKNVSAEAINISEDKSSLLSLLGRGLEEIGLTGSSDHEDKPETTIPLGHDFENISRDAVSHSIPEAVSKGKLDSPASSPPPSPTLEHMKISFRPIDGFETSRLKLNYPEGVDHHEIRIDAFPSFQLVPEITNLKHDIGSDSDDDTFSRSYACMSDDYLGHLSDSNSVEWESTDTSSESNDHALYDGLHRRAFAESTSNFLQQEETADGSIGVASRFVGAVHSELGTSFDFRILDTKNPFTYQKIKQCRHTEEVESSHFQQLTPQTPPLPPLQWRVSRPLLDVEDGKQDQETHCLNLSLDPKLSGSSISDLPKMDTAVLLRRSEESPMIAKAKKVNEPKLDPQNRNCEVANGRNVDDREDFLHQIRTKSFNLRRTETSRSTCTSSTATSNKVTAILQKANAIRQAVGSDGEDDSWSDT